MTGDVFTDDDVANAEDRMRQERAAPVGSLDEAWAAAEAALPEGWFLDDVYQGRQVDGPVIGGWMAAAEKRDPANPSRFWRCIGSGDTPAAALQALAVKLREEG